MSNQVISFIGQEKLELSQKMRVIPTFSFYSTRTIEPKQSPGREKHEIGHSYRSIAGYRSITLHETTRYASHHFRNLRPIHEAEHNPLICIDGNMVYQGVPQRFIEVYRNFLQFRQPEQNAAENHGCGFYGFLPFQQGFICRFLFFIRKSGLPHSWQIPPWIHPSPVRYMPASTTNTGCWSWHLHCCCTSTIP